MHLCTTHRHKCSQLHCSQPVLHTKAAVARQSVCRHEPAGLTMHELQANPHNLAHLQDKATQLGSKATGHEAARGIWSLAGWQPCHGL